MTIRGLSHLLQKSSTWCIPKIEDILATNPDRGWSKEYLTKSGNVILHYSPELIALLTEESERFEEAPEGWMSMKRLAKVVDKHRDWCGPKIEGILATNPDRGWSKEYLDKSGKVVLHYSPELVNKIVELRAQEEK